MPSLTKLECMSEIPLPSSAAAALIPTVSETVLEEYAPFPPLFYQNMSRLFVTSLSMKPIAISSGPTPTLTPNYPHLSDMNVTIRCVRLLRQLISNGGEGGFVLASLLSAEPSSFPHVLTALSCHFRQLPLFESLVRRIQKQHRGTAAKAAVGSSLSSSPSTQRRLMEDMTRYCGLLDEEWGRHLENVEILWGEVYKSSDAVGRRVLRGEMGRLMKRWDNNNGYCDVWSSHSGLERSSHCGVNPLLQALRRVTAGVVINGEVMMGGGGNEWEHLLQVLLLPLHKPHQMVLWRDQTPVLELYHEALVLNIINILQRRPQFTERVILSLLHPDIWSGGSGGGNKPNVNNSNSNNSFNANTPKIILLFHEIETLLAYLGSENMSMGGTKALLRRLDECIRSDNFRMAERALQFWKNKAFCQILETHMGPALMTTVMRTLCRCDRGMEKSWNPTVNKMTKLCLDTMEAMNKDLFWICAGNLLDNKDTAKKDRNSMSISTATDKKKTLTKTTAPRPVRIPPSTVTKDMLSLKGAMGGWKPPPSKKGRSSKNSTTGPPPTVTGVAPWAIASSQTSQSRHNVNNNPPVTVTGVAPWAMNTSKTAPLTSSKDPQQQSPPPSSPSSIDRVRAYIQSLTPHSDDSSSSSSLSEDNLRLSWKKAQLAESPVLLPQLKFHDLVFGKVLGRGAFSEVQYARRIDKGRTRSLWQEFAVKIISSAKIIAHHYTHSISREIAILSSLSHPNISRLISSFRFQTGAYLVLEYASRGDLHTLLSQLQGRSLSHFDARFVMGEILAALSSIHEVGFVFGDLKPENVLLTDSGHVKVTDFGGARPITTQGKDIVKKGRKALFQLKNGDWREEIKQSNSNNENSWIETTTNEDDDETNDKTEITHNDDDEYDDDNDDRIEGTTAYLPPEVALGYSPTLTADTWAWGCVLHQCLSGRPPFFLQDDDEATKHKIVSFRINNHNDDDDDKGFFSKGEFQEETKQLIKLCWEYDQNERPGMDVIASHSYFEGVNVFELYRGEAPDWDELLTKSNSGTMVGGGSSKEEDERWTRRQFSSIWAPQPKAYGADDDDAAAAAAGGRQKQQGTGKTIVAYRRESIEEGEEKGAFFLPVKNVSSAGATENSTEVGRDGNKVMQGSLDKINE